MKKILITLILSLLLFSCTENQRAKEFGGNQTIYIKPNEVLINITWKDADMWVLTEDTNSHIKYFRENSQWGLMNGTVTIKNQ